MNLVLRLLIYIAVGYGVLVLAVFLWQKNMIFFPDRERPSGSNLRTAGLRFWPDAGENYRGFAGISSPVEAKGTVVVFHGNAGAAWYRNYYVQALTPLGYQVVLAEYPGYGGRGGTLGEGEFVEDAKATIKCAHEAFGGPLFLWGESLGCGVAAAVIPGSPVPVEGMVMVTPWDSLPDLAQILYWYLPARWITRDKFDNAGNLQSFQKPVAILLAENDEIIPGTCSLRLYESLTAPKKLWVLKNAGHNSWPTDPGEKWWREVTEFISTKTEANNI